MSDRFEKAYNKLREKYKQLPDFKKIDSDFEFSSIKDEDINERFLSRIIKRRIYDRIHYFNGGLLGVISPQAPSIIIAHENKFLTNKDREEAMSVVRVLMHVEREYLISETKPDEKRDVNLIMASINVWNGSQPVVERILTIMRDSWGKKEDFKIEDYFG
ncbi:MAG: hypothetical protein V1645_04285 [archaeon]